MIDPTRPVAKSLHTITVIVQVTKLHQTLLQTNSFDEALGRALETLGLANRPDPYGLAAAAMKQLQAA
jgi:hypothetical protein